MKVLLIDDHPLMLSALQAVIRGLGDNVTVVGASSARAARQSLREQSDHDLVLLDLQLGDANGFELLNELREAYPALPVVVLSASDRSSDVIRAIDLGAMGFVPKRSSNEALFEALRLVMSGGIYVPPLTMASEPKSRRVGGDTDPGYKSIVPGTADGSVQPQTLQSIGLTPRQTEVLALLLQGKPNKLIARELNLSVETVKDHVAAVLRGLDVTSRTQAVLAIGQMTRELGRGHGWLSSTTSPMP